MANPAGQAFTGVELQELLRNVAGASKAHKVNIKCKSCSRSYEYAVDFPDKRVQLDAIKFAHENGYGKAASAKQDDAEKANLGLDVYTLNPEALQAHREAIAKAYPEAATTFDRRAIPQAKVAARARPST